MIRKITILLLMVLVVAAVYFYADAFIRGKIEKSITKRLQSKVGPAQSYKVGVSGSLINMIRGKLAGLDIRGNDVHLRNGVTLDDLHVKLHGIAFDPRKAAISAIDKTTFEGLLAQDELNSYVSKTHPDISEMNISLQDGYLTMTARPMMIRSDTIIDAQGTLEIIDGSKVVLNFSRVQADGRPASESSRAYLVSTVNPVFDTADISFQPKLSSVTIVPGAIKLVGQFDSLDARAF